MGTDMDTTTAMQKTKTKKHDVLISLEFKSLKVRLL